MNFAKNFKNTFRRRLWYLENLTLKLLILKKGSRFSGSKFFRFQVFQVPGILGSRFFMVQIFQGPGFSESGSRVRVQVLEVAVQFFTVVRWNTKHKKDENTRTERKEIWKKSKRNRVSCNIYRIMFAFLSSTIEVGSW